MPLTTFGLRAPRDPDCQWLSRRIGLEPCAAREKVRFARALGSLPQIDEALRRGQVS